MRLYLRKRLTQQQIVDAWEAETGVRVSRSAIAMAIKRYDLTPARPRPRYDDVLPWRVRSEHQNNHNARMLRLEGRRRRGDRLSEKEARWLADWKSQLSQWEAVVVYHPDTPEGFHWVKRNKYDEGELVRPELRNGPRRKTANMA